MAAGKTKIMANQNGFSYILVLTVVMIMGIMLGLVGQSWKTIKQRELEEEMIFRGDQIAELIYQKTLCTRVTDINQNLWMINSPNGTVLNDLVIGKEERCFQAPNKKFRLRPSTIIDPMTNKQWKLESPVGSADRFAGVRSESGSAEKPFRQDFKAMYDSELLNNKDKYSDWAFTWELKKPAVIQTVKPL